MAEPTPETIGCTGSTCHGKASGKRTGISHRLIRSIGAAIAVRLAAEGASVMINYAASPGCAEAVVDEIKNAGGRAEAFGADLSTTEGIMTLISSVDRAFGGTFSGRIEALTWGTSIGSTTPGLYGIDATVPLANTELTEMMRVAHISQNAFPDSGMPLTRARPGVIVA